jgi:hypothetical protein
VREHLVAPLGASSSYSPYKLVHYQYFVKFMCTIAASKAVEPKPELIPKPACGGVRQ